MRDKRGTHLIAHFEVRLTDSGTQPRLDFPGTHRHLTHSGFENAVRQPSPSCMSRSNNRAITGRQQHRHTIRDLDNADVVGNSGY